MSIDLFVVTIATVLNLGLTSFVYLRNPRYVVNQVFGLFGSSIVLWTLCNFLADHMTSHNLLLTRLTLAAGTCIGASIFLLSTVFPKRLKLHRRVWLGFGGFTASVILLCFTGYFVPSVIKGPEGVTLSVGTLYPYFTFYLIFIVIWSVMNLRRQYQHSTPIEKNQIKLFTLGLILYTSLAIFSNVVLPILIDSWSSSRLGPIFTVPFIGLTSYTIVKHGLFDIKKGITRIIGYSLTISLVATLYSILIITTGIYVVNFGRLTMPQVLALTGSTILFGLTFHWLQEYIATFSRRVFYQDSYDLRATLDNLSDVLVANNSMEVIINGSLEVIGAAIKPSNSYLVVLDDDGEVYRTAVIDRSPITNVKKLVQSIKNQSVALFARDLLPTTVSVAKAMHEEDISLLLRLGSSQQPIGFLGFGHKQNGSIYTKQDMDLLRISAKNLAVALANAKKI